MAGLICHLQWHLDEITETLVHGLSAGKWGYRWYLWLFQSADVVYFQLDPTRCTGT